MKQDKFAEIKASGAVLDRFDPRVWDKHLPYKVMNLQRAGLTTLRDSQILDFGCGPGTYGIVLGKQNHVIGIDIAKQAVAQAIDRAEIQHSDFSAIVADAENLCFRPSIFDVCFSGWAIHHLPDPNFILSQFCSLLRPGGLVAIIEPNEESLALRFSRFVENLLRRWILKVGLDTPNRFTHTSNEYVKALELNGFKITTIFSYYNGEKPEIPSNTNVVTRFSLRMIAEARNLFLLTASNIFHQGAEIFILARKPQ